MAFRNVRSLLANVGALLDHQPNNLDVREDRLDAINRTYLDVSTQFDWLFLQKEADWNVWEDVTGTSTGYTVAVTNGTYAVTFSTALGAAFIAEMVGCDFTDDNGTVYTIVRFSSTTLAYLSDVYAGTTRPALATWTLSRRAFPLPVDCARALGFIDRTNGLGRLQIIDRRREETYLSTQSTSTGTPYWLVDDEMVFDRPPDPGLTATDSTSAGTVAGNSIYEYCYTFTGQGRESAPSPTARVTTSSGATHQVTVAGIEDTRTGALLTGIKKRLYRREISSGGALTNTFSFGRWLFLAQMDEADTSYVDDGSPVPSLSEALSLRYQHGRKHMRPKLIAAEDATLRLRYLRYPKRLVADSDAPVWPEAYHDLILYGAAVDLGMQHGLTGKVPQWEKQYEQMLRRMKASHLAVPDAPSRKQSWGSGGGGNPYNAGTVTTDFSG